MYNKIKKKNKNKISILIIKKLYSYFHEQKGAEQIKE